LALPIIVRIVKGIESFTFLGIADYPPWFHTLKFITFWKKLVTLVRPVENFLMDCKLQFKLGKRSDFKLGLSHEYIGQKIGALQQAYHCFA